MPHPLRRTIARYTQAAPEALMTRDALTTLDRMIGGLPAALCNWIYFESRLSRTDSRLDGILGIDDVGRSVIADQHPRVKLPASLHERQVWRGLRALARAAGPGGTLRGAIDHLWLEFDATDGAAASDLMGDPGVFCGFGEARSPAYSPLAWAHRIHASIELLQQRPISPGASHALTRCLTMLPAYAYVPSVGVFPSRDGGVMRLCVIGLTPTELRAYLHDVGWRGSFGPLASYAGVLQQQRSFAPHPTVGMVHIDIGETIVARVGLEYQLDRRAQLEGRIAEVGVVERFVADGLCTPEKAAALAAWPYHAIEVLPHEIWSSRLVRWMNHFKLVLEPDGRLDLKAYLCAFHSPSTCSTRTAATTLWRPRHPGNDDARAFGRALT